MENNQINMVPVTSSNVKNVGYDAESKTLAVEFGNDNVYHYSDVPEEHYVNLLASETPGSYLHSVIKGKFECKKQ